jgi:hypothetical protein
MPSRAIDHAQSDDVFVTPLVAMTQR